MSNEDAQELTAEELADVSAIAQSNGRYGILYTAYMEDKAKWQKARDKLDGIIYDTILDIKRAAEQVDKESGAIKFLYNKVFRRPTPASSRLSSSNKTLDELTKEMTRLSNAEPNPDIYEIAMLGNNLFKPR